MLLQRGLKHYGKEVAFGMEKDDLTGREEARDEGAPSTRERIMLAAIEVFAEKGLHGASMAEIANLAGITGGAMYRYFESKEQIFEAVVDVRSVPIQALDMVRELIPELEPKTATKFLMRAMFLYFYADLDFFRMVFGEIMKSPEAANTFLEKAVAPARDFFRDAFTIWQEKGLLHEGVDPVVAASIFLGMTGFLLVEKDILKYQAFEGIEIDALVEKHNTIFLEGILKET